LKALHERGLNVPNTRKETLEPYEGDELVDIIRDCMDASKILGTYITGIVDDIYSDMKVHPDWKTPTENGRPRCADPNMLGMPRKAEIEEHRWKRYVKEIFIAEKGSLFMHLDRKQSEVRCEVFLAKALKFIETLRIDRDADIHGMFTKMLYGEGYTKEQRVLVKMVVFGLIYGREAGSLARQFTAIERKKAKKAGKTEWHIWTVREAQRFIDDFFKLFPELLTYRKECKDIAKETGRLTDFFGRVRHFGLVNRDNAYHIETQAVNYPPSSLSAGINFHSCIETDRLFGKYGVVVLVPVHDSALLKVPKDSLYLKDEIQGMWEALAPKLVDFDIPFPCDVTIGERWSDL
jgi:DNA polymerase-1